MGDPGAPAPAGFELTEHTADVGLHAWAPDEAGVFEQAGLGLVSLVCDPVTVAARETYTIVADAPAGGLDSLLVAFLNELLYRIETDAIVFNRFAIADLTETSLVARAAGEPLEPERHRAHLGVKAATYHGLSLARGQRGWEARVVLDV